MTPRRCGLCRQEGHDRRKCPYTQEEALEYKNALFPPPKVRGRCGLCRQEGHNRSKCPYTPEQALEYKNAYVPPKKNKKRLNKPQDLKSRASSMTNATAVMIARKNSVEVTDEQVKERNDYLGIKAGQCFICKGEFEEEFLDSDHWIPICSIRNNIFGQHNQLNIFPVCSKCNGSKGGKTGEKLYEWLKYKKGFSDIQIEKIRTFTESNKIYLYLNNDEVVNQQLSDVHYIVRKIHETVDEGSKNIIEDVAEKLRGRK